MAHNLGKRSGDAISLCAAKRICATGVVPCESFETMSWEDTGVSVIDESWKADETVAQTEGDLWHKTITENGCKALTHETERETVTVIPTGMSRAGTPVFSVRVKCVESGAEITLTCEAERRDDACHVIAAIAYDFEGTTLHPVLNDMEDSPLYCCLRRFLTERGVSDAFVSWMCA
ncbi:hypothetical protein nvc1_141 [Namao virus]|nr:hypothetical protein nvc1_141 [Namao virus]